MAQLASMPRLQSGGHVIEPDSLGFLFPSDPAAHTIDVLRQRMADEGYLYLRGGLDRQLVLEARAAVTQKLQRDGYLLAGSEPSEAIFNTAGRPISFKPELADDNPPLARLLYDGPMMDFFGAFLGGAVRHYDFTWMRAVGPGTGTPSHCDVVYMGRGTTTSLYTAWTPLGDIDFVQGGLMILEGSHRNERLKETYGRYDVDTFCSNKPEVHGWKRGGHLSRDPNQISRSIGGRWLTSEFSAGDVLIFTPYTVHASLDNRSDRIRLSSDTRYQRADEPADERWIGENPIGHTEAGKRGRVC